ncbi:MAG: hypothetical protein ABL982_16155, partial [Vicinamibacterales bacterium]
MVHQPPEALRVEAEVAVAESTAIGQDEVGCGLLRCEFESEVAVERHCQHLLANLGLHRLPEHKESIALKLFPF